MTIERIAFLATMLINPLCCIDTRTVTDVCGARSWSAMTTTCTSYSQRASPDRSASRGNSSRASNRSADVSSANTSGDISSRPMHVNVPHRARAARKYHVMQRKRQFPAALYSSV
jgi:hypothetical protein